MPTADPQLVLHLRRLYLMRMLAIAIVIGLITTSLIWMRLGPILKRRGNHFKQELEASDEKTKAELKFMGFYPGRYTIFNVIAQFATLFLAITFVIYHLLTWL